MENIIAQELPANLTFDRQAYKWKNDVISVPALCTTLSFVNTENGVDVILSDKPLTSPVSKALEQCENYKIGSADNLFVDLNDLRQRQDFIAYFNAVLGDDFVSIDLECYWVEAKDEWVENRGFQYLADTDDGICDLDDIVTYLLVDKINIRKREQLN